MLKVGGRHPGGDWKGDSGSTVGDLGWMWISGRHLSLDDSWTHGSS